MKRILLALSACFILFQPFAMASFSFFGAAAAYAQNDWKQTFNEVCAKTQNAMAYSPEELRDFIATCDSLKTDIERLGEPQRTIFLKRLQRCKGVFVYVLEAKEKQ